MTLRSSLPDRARLLQWGPLLAGSAILASLLELVRLPAALLLGPMITGILIGVRGGTIRVPRLPYYCAQAVIGCLVARAITSSILGTFLKEWPLLIGIMLTIIVASSLMGWAVSRWGTLPGSTAIWGLSPGAAVAMMLMAEAFGADARLVAFMQYLRVVFVAITASLIARFWITPDAAAHAAIVWFPALHWPAFLQTLAIAAIGGVLGRLSRLPAGVLIAPMVIGAALNAGSLVTIELPPWLLAACYTLLGWNIGLGFTREILLQATRALLQIVVSIVALIAFCGGLAWLLVETLHIDGLTAYLATSPGGMDSVAIIAASSKVGVPFVMALQTVRFAMVLLVGPSIARFVARRIAHGMTAAAINQ